MMIMGMRLVKTKKAMPAGLVAALSAAGLCFNVLKIQK